MIPIEQSFIIVTIFQQTLMLSSASVYGQFHMNLFIQNDSASNDVSHNVNRGCFGFRGNFSPSYILTSCPFSKNYLKLFVENFQSS